MPGDSGVLVVTRVRSTTIIAHETAGALGIRHSPRPLSGGRFLARLGCSAPRGREVVSEISSAVIASEATQSSIRSANLTIFWRCDLPRFSFRRGRGARFLQRTVNGFSRRCAVQRPPCFLAGFCFLSAPEGRLGGLRLGTQGLREITRPLQRFKSSAPAKGMPR